MRVRYVWRNGQRGVRVIDDTQDPASGYHEDAQDFIETGEWGALDPDLNQHLVKYRERFLRKLQEV